MSGEELPVIAVRVLAGDGRERARVDWLDGRWSCENHPRNRSCEHRAAVAAFMLAEFSATEATR